MDIEKNIQSIQIIDINDNTFGYSRKNQYSDYSIKDGALIIYYHLYPIVIFGNGQWKRIEFVYEDFVVGKFENN